MELKEGTTVHISTGRYKGRAAIYKVTILKVCAFRSNWFHFIPRRRYHAPEPLAEDNYGKQIRDVRQPLSQVRLSLSVSLGAGQIIFLVGINATENMAACITAAALLQYFLMAAFCWMLVEGIYLYLFVVKVYNINTKTHRPSYRLGGHFTGHRFWKRWTPKLHQLGVKAGVVMIPLLGVTWLFGFLSPLHKVSPTFLPSSTLRRGS